MTTAVIGMRREKILALEWRHCHIAHPGTDACPLAPAGAYGGLELMTIRKPGVVCIAIFQVVHVCL